MAEKVVHGYWGIRALAQVDRLLLAYTGAVWEDTLYTAPEQWFGKDKEGLGLSFPNIPYLIDGEYKLTESSAIMRYIPKRFGKPELLGKDLKDQGVVDCLLGVFGDTRQAFQPLFFDKEWETKVAGAVAKAEPKLKQFSDFYGEKEFALGYVTVFDFWIAEFSHWVEKISPETYAKFGFLKKVREAIESLPAIKAYYESEKAVKGPFLPQTAAVQF